MKLKILILLLLSINLVGAGVSHPRALKLAPGETGEFRFAIDAALFDVDLQCTIEFEGQTDLDVKFDTEEVLVKAGERVFITGKVKVPKDSEVRSYKEEFCVSCDKVVQVAGGGTRPRYCDIPISVSVVEKESPGTFLSASFIILLIIVIILSLILISIIIIKRRKRMKL